MQLTFIQKFSTIYYFGLNSVNDVKMRKFVSSIN